MTKEKLLDKITHVVIGYTTEDMPVYFDSDVPVFKKVMEIIDSHTSDLRKENEELKSTIVKWHNDINDQLTIISELKKRIEELENPIPCSHPKIVSVAHAYMCEECKKCLI